MSATFTLHKRGLVMAVRYSGNCAIGVVLTDCGGLSRWHNPPAYKVTVTVNRERVWTGTVRGAASDTRPVDIPEVYDDIAHAGLSFADHDGADIQPEPDEHGSGWAVTRRKVSR